MNIVEADINYFLQKWQLARTPEAKLKYQKQLRVLRIAKEIHERS